MKIRDYQQKSIESIIKNFDNGAISGVNAMATGTGKTIITIEVTMDRFSPDNNRSLIIGGVNIDVCNQMEAAFLRHSPQLAGFYGENGHSMRGIGMVMGQRNDVNSRIVVASIQTLLRGLDKEHDQTEPFTDKDVYMEGDRIYKAVGSKLPYLVSPRMDAILEYGSIDFWVHDEVHHAPADGTLGVIRRLEMLYEFLEIDKMRFLGNTATPVRTDGRALFNVCERVFYSYPLHKAQEDGWIVPFADPQQVSVDLGYDRSNSSTEKRVDDVQNWAELVAKSWKELCLNEDGSHRPTVMYTGNIHDYGPVAASKVLAARLNEQGIRAVHVDATTTIDIDGTVSTKSARADVYKRLIEGDIEVITNAKVIIEGVDIPPISAIFLLQEMNELIFTQVTGRGTRLFPGNAYLPAKEDLLIVDFTGQPLVTSAICSLMGYMVDEEKQEFVQDWSGLWDEFTMIWANNTVEIQEWLGDMERLRPDMYRRFEEAINLALMKDDSFDTVHARIIRQMIAVFGEDSLLDERDLIDEGYVQGESVVYKLAEIISSANDDWYVDPSTSIMSLPVGNNESLMITPPDWTHSVTVETRYKDYMENVAARDEKTIKLFSMALPLFGEFTLWRVTAPKPQRARARPLYSDSNLVELFNSSMNYIMEEMEPEDIFMKKGKRWKQKKTQGKRVEPSDGQMHYVRKLSSMNGTTPPAKDELTKGEASQLINFLAGAVPIKNILDKVNLALELTN